jgi:hypothetical protein
MQDIHFSGHRALMQTLIRLTILPKTLFFNKLSDLTQTIGDDFGDSATTSNRLN